MKLIKAGNKHKRIWRGTCRHCDSEFEDTDETVRLGKLKAVFVNTMNLRIAIAQSVEAKAQ
jgi:hypothetical protein